MKFSHITDWAFEVALGRIDGITLFDVFGENPDVDAAEDIWAAGGTYTYLTTAVPLNVLSGSGDDVAAGDGAQTGTLIGLNANWDLVEETITFTGATRVVTENVYIRFLRLTVDTAGVDGGNAGIITIDSGNATAVLGSIAVGDNRTLLSQFSVPRNHTGLIQRMYFSAKKGDDANVTLLTRPFGGVFFPVRRTRIFQAHVPINLSTFFEPIPEKSDLKMRVLEVSNPNSEIVGGYDIYLVDQDKQF